MITLTITMDNEDFDVLQKAVRNHHSLNFRIGMMLMLDNITSEYGGIKHKAYFDTDVRKSKKEKNM